MRISKRTIVGGIVIACCAFATANCEPPGDCLRNSDCDQGLACSAGHCVVPTPSAGDASESDASGLTDAAAGVPDTTTTSVVDSSVADSSPHETSAASSDGSVNDSADEISE
jgi:hypothetical protein